MAQLKLTDVRTYLLTLKLANLVYFKYYKAYNLKSTL